jgi:hypothetical protein
MIRALCLLALTAPSALAAYCSGSPDEGTRTNENPISDQGAPLPHSLTHSPTHSPLLYSILPIAHVVFLVDCVPVAVGLPVCV